MSRWRPESACSICARDWQRREAVCHAHTVCTLQVLCSRDSARISACIQSSIRLEADPAVTLCSQPWQAVEKQSGERSRHGKHRFCSTSVLEKWREAQTCAAPKRVEKGRGWTFSSSCHGRRLVRGCHLDRSIGPNSACSPVFFHFMLPCAGRRSMNPMFCPGELIIDHATNFLKRHHERR